MDERVIQFRVGVVVVAAASITIILTMLFGAQPAFLQSQYTLHIRFPEAPGVAEDTPVLKSGVHIGRVTGVRLLDEGGVVLSMKVDSKYKLRLNEVCRISTGSLVTGDAVLEWVLSDAPGLPKDHLRDGDYLTNGELSGDPFEVLVNLEEKMSTALGSIETAGVSIQSAGNEVATLVRGLSTTVGNNEDQIRRIMQKSEIALDRFHETMTSINDVVGDPQLKDGLKQSMEDLPKIFDQTQEVLSEAKVTLSRFQRMSERAETNLANLENFTQPLGDRGEALVQNLDQSMQNLDELLAQMLQFSRNLNQSEGTLGKLLNDAEMYERLNRAAANAEDLTRRMRPILDDVRVFTDKIARDPRQLGVKGALDRRPSGSGLKFGLPR